MGAAAGLLGCGTVLEFAVDLGEIMPPLRPPTACPASPCRRLRISTASAPRPLSSSRPPAMLQHGAAAFRIYRAVSNGMREQLCRKDNIFTYIFGLGLVGD